MSSSPKRRRRSEASVTSIRSAPDSAARRTPSTTARYAASSVWAGHRPTWPRTSSATGASSARLARAPVSAVLRQDDGMDAVGQVTQLAKGAIDLLDVAVDDGDRASAEPRA